MPIIASDPAEFRALTQAKQRIDDEVAAAEAALKVLKTRAQDAENDLWMRVGWQELEDYLRANGSKDPGPGRNPVVRNDPANRHYGTSYCKLNEEGRLQIGSYPCNDRFPTGQDLYVRKDLAPYH